MEIGIWFWMGLAVSLLLWVVFIVKTYRRPIIVKDTNDIFGWFSIHFIVFFLTIACMSLCDVANEAVGQGTRNLDYIPFGIKGMIYLFIQNGGLVIIAMLLSSLVYSIYISGTSRGYFIARHKWVKKLFYSLICISLIICYWHEIGRDSTNENSVLKSYIVMWLITLIQIWVSFGMDFYRPVDIIRGKKRFFDLFKDKSEMLEMFVCISSMILCPILLGVEMYFSPHIPESIKIAFSQGSKGVIFSVILAVLVLLMLKGIKSPFISKMICKKQFRNAKKNFMGVRYAILRGSREVFLEIFEEKLEIAEDILKRDRKIGHRIFTCNCNGS